MTFIPSGLTKYGTKQGFSECKNTVAKASTASKAQFSCGWMS